MGRPNFACFFMLGRLSENGTSGYVYEKPEDLRLRKERINNQVDGPAYGIGEY